MDAVALNSGFVNELQDAMMQKFWGKQRKTDDCILEVQKVMIKRPQQNRFRRNHCLLLNPKLLEQSTVIDSQVQNWLPLYKLEKVLTDSNYIIRKVKTNYTQCVHRIRLKPIKPSETPEDLEVVNPVSFQPDPSRRQHMEPELFDKHIPDLICHEPDPVRVTINVPLGGPLAGPAAAAPPAAPPPAPPRVVAPAVRPRTAPIHLPVFDSSSSDEAIPNLF